MTLGEALDAGLVELIERRSWSRTREDSRGRALEVTHYYAREVGNEDVLWDIGATLYRSRKGTGPAFVGRSDDGGTATPNGGYYVWVVGKDGVPLLEGPYGPHELSKAKQLARIGATEGKHNRAVSRGLHPTEPSFELVREYEAGSGERLL